MTKQLDFYFDFTSPYAYIAATRIDELANRYGYEAIWKPFLIGAALGITGRVPSLQSPMVDDYVLNDVSRTARQYNITMQHPEKFPILSVKASRLFNYLSANHRQQAKAKQFALAVYQAYFKDGKDISSQGVLSALAGDFGLNEQQAVAAMTSMDAKNQFKNDINQALAKGVFAVPMFAVEGELFWGVDHLAQLEEWLRTGGW